MLQETICIKLKSSLLGNKARLKEHIQCDSIHMAFSKGQNYRVSNQRLPGPGNGGEKLSIKGHERIFWNNGNILYLNVVKFIPYRSLSKFLQLYT